MKIFDYILLSVAFDLAWCGKEKPPLKEKYQGHERRRTNRILGAVDVMRGEAIFMGSLQRKADRLHRCNSVLFTLKHLVTACSCVSISHPHSTEDYIVVAGDRYNTNKLDVHTRNVTKFTPYKRCKYNPDADMWDFNLGYITLEKPFQISSDLAFVKSIPENQAEYETGLGEFSNNEAYNLSGDQYCFVFGWGTIVAEKIKEVFVTFNQPELNKKRAVQFIKNSECRNRFCGINDKACKFDFKNDVFCAVAAGEGAGPLCYGDNGAPLICGTRLWGIGALAFECGTEIKATIFHKLDIDDLLSYSLAVNTLCSKILILVAALFWP